MSVAFIVALALAPTLLTGASSGSDDSFLSEARDGSVELTAWQAAQVVEAARRTAPQQMLVRYMRAPQCNVPTGGYAEPGPAVGEVVGGDPALPACGATNGTVQPPICADGPATLPLWRQTRPTVTTPWPGLPWELVRSYGCPEDLVPPLTAEDFRRLPLPAPVLTVQPARDWVLVNKQTVVYTDPAPVVLQTDLLGYPVEVQATPSRFTYDFGDGSAPLTTTSPGAPWPHHDTWHVYRQLGSRSIALTTTWSGRYRVAGTTAWHDVADTATTTATSAPFRVEELRAHLVSGNCGDDPTAPGCD